MHRIRIRVANVCVMASHKRKYYNWLLNCNQMIREREIKLQNDIVCFVTTIMLTHQTKKRHYSKKKFWVAPLFENRYEYGFYKATLPYVRLEDARFKNYFRMSSIQLENLLQIVAPKLNKQTFLRKPISAEERLCLTLRYLASGDSMVSMSYQYLIGCTTISNIISETCEVIWNMLCPVSLPPSLTKEDWLHIAANFETQCNFPHCIGAIDGKHIVIQCPHNAGSKYYNYKHSHSVVLMAICDANYLFTFVDIGAYGRRSDGGIFKECQFGKKFEQKKMNIPDAEIVSENGPTLPYCLVGDEAFPLKDYLLRPYPGRSGLTKEKAVFNYRLSSARRMIENTFGILACQWRILRKPIIAMVETVEKIVQAIVCLHNWLRRQDININEYVTTSLIDHFGHNDFIPGTWRTILENSSGYREIQRTGSYMSTRTSIEIREQFCTYFNNEGSVPWQDKFA